jgi:GTP cyclohydrolase II
VDRVSIEIPPTEENKKYLQTKKKRWDIYLEVV